MEKQQTPTSVSTPDRTCQPDQDQTHGKETTSSNEVIAEKTTENNEEAEDDYEYITGIKLLIVMSAVTLVAFLMLLDTSIIATAVPRITSDFHSLRDVGWYGSAYLISNCSLQPLTGKMYTQFSSKYTFLAFLALFEFGSLLCGVSISSNMLIVGRATAGLGCSGLMNGALTIISACAPLEKRPVLMGTLMSFASLGILCGPLVGGALTQYTTWRWCFYINLPAGAAIAIFLVLIRIPDRVVRSDTKSTLLAALKKLDLLGFALFAPAATMFLLALTWGGTQYPWSSATIIGLFCGAAGTLCTFMAWENRRGNEAMVPLSMVRRTVVWSSSLTMLFFSGSMLVTNYYLPIYFQTVKGVTPTMSGVYTLPGVLSQMLFSIISGVLAGKLGYYLPWIITSSVLASIGTGLMSTFTTETTTATWIGYQIISGAGRGCGFQMPLVAIQNTLPQSQTSIGTSLVIFSQALGGALFLTIGETIFSHGLADALSTYAPAVDAQKVIGAGASGVRDVVDGADLKAVLVAYSKAVGHNFCLAAGASVAAFFICWGMGWKKVGKKRVKEGVKKGVKKGYA